MPAQFTIIFRAILPLAFLIFAWVSIGTPKILKRTAMLAVIVPAVHLLFLLMTGSRNIFSFFVFVKDIIVCAIPFLCVFLNARRFYKTTIFKRVLMFCLSV